MSLLILSFLLLCLVRLAFEDFRGRTISLWTVLATVSLSVWFSEMSNGWHFLAFNFTINLVVIGVEIVLISIYYSIKEGTVKSPINQYIGLGDIVFLLVPAILFGPILFSSFLVVTLIVVLLVYLTLYLTRVKFSKLIPLAGCLAISTIVVMLISFWFDLKSSNFEEMMLTRLNHGNY